MTLRKPASLIALISLIFLIAPRPAAAAYSQEQAAAFLKSRPIDEWSIMALASANSLSEVSLDFLKAPVTSGSATDYEKRILALVAAGQNPSTFGQENFVARLKEKVSGGQIGDLSLVNDDIFGVLALAAAGETESAAAQSSRNFILSKQNSDGGWSWAVDAASDSNDTAMAISALLASGSSPADQSITKAVSYLNTTKSANGGYSYQAGFAPDSASTSWVVSALRKAGQNINAQTIGYLENLQTANGSFRWQETDASGSQLMTAFAVIALSGGTYPINGSSGGNPAAGTPMFSVCIYSASVQIWNGQLSFGPPSKAIDTVPEAARLGGFSYQITNTSFGPYVQSIAGEAAQGPRGWFYQVNGTLPNVGATDFLLSSGDRVTWYYGQFGDPAPGCGGSSSNQSQNVSLALEIEIPVAPPPVIAFTVTPASLNFGRLRPGDGAVQTLSVQNTGAVPITVTVQVSGSDNIFRDNLKLNGQPWQNYNSRVLAKQTTQTSATITVPTSVTGGGSRQATLTFWATP